MDQPLSPGYHNSGRQKRASAKKVNYAKLSGLEEEGDDPFWSDEEEDNIVATTPSPETQKKPRLSISLNKKSSSGNSPVKKIKLTLRKQNAPEDGNSQIEHASEVQTGKKQGTKTKGLLNPHIHEILTRDFDDLSKVLRVVYNGKSLSSDAIREHGLSHPLLVQDTPQSLDMKVPENLTVREVANHVGNDTPINVMDCTGTSQEELHGWTLGKLVKHFEDPKRMAFAKALEQVVDKHPDYITESDTSKLLAAINSSASAAIKAKNNTSRFDTKKRRKSYLEDSEDDEFHESDFESDESLGEAAMLSSGTPRILNQISLELSNTPMMAHVQSPKFVREIDWIDRAWPQDRKTMETRETTVTNAGTGITSYPRVQYYCLTSTAGCYTDFHLDFGGTSVWYHVVSGQKVFLLVPPNKQNLEAYESWLCSANQARTFFAGNGTKNRAQQCYKVILQQSQTLIIPSGWIHAVYTPRDSLVLGGNFLHSLDVSTQLEVHCIETRTRVPKKFRFPHYIQINFFAAASLLRHMRASVGKIEKTRSIITPRELTAIPPLIEALKQWNVGDSDNSDDAGFGSVVEVALTAAQSVGCSTAADMFSQMESLFNTEFKQQGKCRITSNPNHSSNYHRLPLAPVPWSMYPSKKMNSALAPPSPAKKNVSPGRLKRTASTSSDAHPTLPVLDSPSGKARTIITLPGVQATGNIHASKMFRGVATHSQGGGAAVRALLNKSTTHRGSSTRERLKKKWKI